MWNKWVTDVEPLNRITSERHVHMRSDAFSRVLTRSLDFPRGGDFCLDRLLISDIARDLRKVRQNLLRFSKSVFYLFISERIILGVLRHFFNMLRVFYLRIFFFIFSYCFNSVCGSKKRLIYFSKNENNWFSCYLFSLALHVLR